AVVVACLSIDGDGLAHGRAPGMGGRSGREGNAATQENSRRTHERRPTVGRRVAAESPPGGDVGPRSAPPRWCSAYCRSLHITSLRLRPTLTEGGDGRKGEIRQPTGWAGRRTLAGRNGRLRRGRGRGSGRRRGTGRSARRAARQGERLGFDDLHRF